MKLEALYLKAFGGFDDHRLDFSGAQPGFHLVYGPNEAGKSTTLRAITQLLYGIPNRTNDDFRHTMKALRIGATLSKDGDRLTFFRRKGNKSTLLAEDDKTPLPDGALLPFLDGVNEEAFIHLFGLSHEQLVRGGEALVQGEGDVGQALFSAAAGMGSLRDVLNTLEERANDLFKPAGSNPRINSALKDVKEKRAALKNAQQLPEKWSGMNEELATERAKRDALLEAIKGYTAEQSRLERILKALPLVAQRLDLLTRIESLGDCVALPDDFRERRIAAVQAHGNATQYHQIAEAALGNVQAQLAALEVDDALLAQESRIEALNGRHGICLKAQEDKRQNLEPDLRQRHGEIRRLRQTLKLESEDGAVESLRPAPGVAQRINELAQSAQSIAKDRAHAVREQEKLLAERQRCEAALATLGEVPDLTPLARAIPAARATASLDAEHGERMANAERLTVRINDALGRLAGWSGTREALEALSVPAASTIERVRIQMESEEAERRRWDEEGRVLEKERSDLASQLNALQRAQHVPTEALLATHRALREKSWQLAQVTWASGRGPESLEAEGAADFLRDLAESAPDAASLVDAVEVLTARADETADRLRRESARAAVVAQLESSHDAVLERIARLEATRAAGDARHEETRTAWLALWESSGIAPKTPMEMAEWRSEYAAILEDSVRAREEEAMLQGLGAKVSHHVGQLTEALTALGLPSAMTDLALLLEDGEDGLESLRNQEQQRNQWLVQCNQAEAALVEVTVALAQVDDAETCWQRDWAAMMEQVGARPDASTAEATAKLEVLTALFAAQDGLAVLEARIAQIDAEYEDYLAAVTELAHAADVTADDTPLEDLVPSLYQQLKGQRQMAATQAGLLNQEREETARLSTEEAALLRAERELSDLFALAGVSTVSALEAADIRSQQFRELQQALRALEARLLDISPGLSLEAFIAMVQAEDPDGATARLHAIGPELAHAEAERQAVSEIIGKRESELNVFDGSDVAAGLAEESEQLLAGIAEDGRQYAQFKIAHFVLSEAIERYRAANQQPLLARAGALFETLTLGSFTELRADFDDRGDHVLHGVRAESEALVSVGAMSEGSADQLYLALRLASLDRHLEKHAPIPFVLDDILVNFDDMRAAAALKVLGDLARRTQVIYFTHHQHLVALAQQHVDAQQLVVHSLER